MFTLAWIIMVSMMITYIVQIRGKESLWSACVLSMIVGVGTYFVASLILWGISSYVIITKGQMEYSITCTIKEVESPYWTVEGDPKQWAIVHKRKNILEFWYDGKKVEVPLSRVCVVTKYKNGDTVVIAKYTVPDKWMYFLLATTFWRIDKVE